MTSQDEDERPRGKAGGRKPASRDGKTAAAEPERISKILARAGIASRRDAERMVMAGRVSVNGKVLETPAVTATLADRIEVDGVPIRGIERTRLWLYHKPAGLVTTNSDPEGRPTVFDNLPPELPRVLTIGRLDINTEGLLLLTNDGGLARVLELPATGWLRRYRVRAHGGIDQAALDRLKEGIAVDGVLYGAIEAAIDRVQGSNVWLTMGLREGKNREIKNVLGALGLTVNRLIRISYGPFQLADLAEGNVREIRGRTLRDQLGPRLIAESGANFEAPVFTEAEPAPEAEKKAEARPERNRAEKPQDKRERVLARLDTRRGDDAPKRRPARRSRASNVWMAPGARPVAPKKAKAAAEAEAAAERRQERREPGSAGRPAAKPQRFSNSMRKEGERRPHRHGEGSRPERQHPQERRAPESAGRFADRPAGRSDGTAGKRKGLGGGGSGRFASAEKPATGTSETRQVRSRKPAGERTAAGSRKKPVASKAAGPKNGKGDFRKGAGPAKDRPRRDGPGGGPRGRPGGRGGAGGADRRR